MKKTLFVFFILSSLICQKLLAQDEYTFSVCPVINLSNGNLYEYVYINDNLSNETKLSELNWEIKNLINLGFSSSFSYKSFNVDLDCLFGIKNTFGKMYDSDWMNYDTPYLYYDSSLKTNLSISNTTISSNIIATIKSSYTFKPWDNISLIPYVAFTYNKINFKGNGANGWYGDSSHSTTGSPVSWDSPYATYYPEGALGNIEYLRNTFWLYLGAKTNFSYKQWIFSFDVGISPFIYIESIDTHYSLFGNFGTYYYDKMSGFFSKLNFSISVSYQITDDSLISLGCEYFKQFEISGKSYISNDYTEWRIQNCISKCSDNLFNVFLNYRFYF